MNSSISRASATPAPIFGVATLALIGLAMVLLLGVIGVTGYFRLSSDAAALRQSLMSGMSGAWQKKFAIHIGPLTTGLVRMCSHWLTLAPEPKAALDAIHGAEVGVYKLQQESVVLDAGAILARTDKAMSARGWQRAVGVSKKHELVAVYLPRRGFSSEHLKCCLLVCQGRDLVVASAQGDLEPLLQIARKQIDLDRVTAHLALR